MTLASTIADYLSSPTDSGINNAKTAVIASLEATNSGAEFSTTDYFNHSFIPDIVGSWPNVGDELEQRFVFLRPNHLPAFVQADVERLAELKPAFVSLTEEDPDLDELEQLDTSTRGDVALANTYALDVLGAADSRLKRENLVSALFLKQARGIIGRNDAVAIDRASAGFAGAISGDANVVSESLGVFSKFLQDEAAASINRAMYYMWKGATSKAYPGAEPVDSWLEYGEIVEILRYLLLRPEMVKPQYWERLAEQVTLEELEGLGTLEATANLQELMRFASSFLRARGVHVDVEDSQPSFVFDQPFEWSIRDRLLQISNQKTIFRLAGDLRRFGGVDAKFPSPTLDNLRERLISLQLEEVAIRSQGLQADLRLEGEHPLTVHRDLGEVVSGIDSSAEIRRVSVRRAQGGASFDCDFQRSILQASGETTQPVSSLVLMASRLLGSLGDNEISQLRHDLGLHAASDG